MITALILVVLRMSASGLASSNTRSARFSGSTVPESSSAARYVAAFRVPLAEPRQRCGLVQRRVPARHEGCSQAGAMAAESEIRACEESARLTQGLSKAWCRDLIERRWLPIKPTSALRRSVPASCVRINASWSPEHHTGRHQPGAVVPETIGQNCAPGGVIRQPDLSVRAGRWNTGQMLNGPLSGV